jgi:hypothetical protein
MPPVFPYLKSDCSTGQFFIKLATGTSSIQASLLDIAYIGVGEGVWRE